jgi:1-deoxy-D-xylulose-5-phosphate synthase
MVVMAAADEAELRTWSRPPPPMTTARSPSAIRAATGVGVDMPERGSSCRSARAASSSRARQVAILSYGTRLADCLRPPRMLDAAGLSTTVADARFAKPLDEELIRNSPATTKC